MQSGASREDFVPRQYTERLRQLEDAVRDLASQSWLPRCRAELTTCCLSHIRC